MCLLVFAHRTHSDYDLIVAANRDEFHARSTAPAAFWSEHPHVVAGKDVEKGGTWMGITTSGRFAALTNFRDPSVRSATAPSRGFLVSEFLIGTDAPEIYLRAVRERSRQYNNFNLFVGNTETLWYFASRTQETRALEPGLYGISNDALDTPWPKVRRAKQRLSRAISADGDIDRNELFDLLADRNTAADGDLPDTGVGPQWERVLSAAFIVTPNYGTRASTVLFSHPHRGAIFVERSFDASGHETSTAAFTLDTGAARRAAANS
jgi:uncharacterized protein with NRDE domain